MCDDLSAGVGRYGADRVVFGAAAALRGLRKGIQSLRAAHSPGRKNLLLRMYPYLRQLSRHLTHPRRLHPSTVSLHRRAYDPRPPQDPTLTQDYRPASDHDEKARLVILG